MKPIKFIKVTKDIRFLPFEGRKANHPFYAYKGDYMAINNGDIWIIKKMKWGSQTTQWIAFNSMNPDIKKERYSFDGLKESIAILFSKVSA